jgi:hypothetical protein
LQWRRTFLLLLRNFRHRGDLGYSKIIKKPPNEKYFYTPFIW